MKKNFKLSSVMLMLFVVFNTSKAQTILHVSTTGSDGNDGSSWNNAFQTLQKALATVSSGSQIWVAKGTYYPDQGGGQTTGDRNASFTMLNEVAIYGGFTGKETSLDDRDLNTNVTTLSGDINTRGDNSDNSFHVMLIDNSTLDNTAVLDGFTITAGNGGGSGGGMLIRSGSPLLVNILFVNNLAGNGGGMYSAFRNNPKLINVAFLNNTGAVRAGGLYDEGAIVLINVSFHGNSSPQGGAIWAAMSLTLLSLTVYFGTMAVTILFSALLALAFQLRIACLMLQ